MNTWLYRLLLTASMSVALTVTASQVHAALRTEIDPQSVTSALSEDNNLENNPSITAPLNLPFEVAQVALTEIPMDFLPPLLGRVVLLDDDTPDNPIIRTGQDWASYTAPFDCSLDANNGQLYRDSEGNVDLNGIFPPASGVSLGVTDRDMLDDVVSRIVSGTLIEGSGTPVSGTILSEGELHSRVLGSLQLCEKERIERSLYHKFLRMNISWYPVFNDFSLLDVAMAENNVYVVSTDGGIYRWTGSTFESFGGEGATAKAIAASSKELWVTNASNDIYRWTFSTSSWEQIPGKAIDISIALDSYESVYIVGEDYSISRLDRRRNEFVKIEGSAVRIAAAPNRRLWALNGNNEVYEWDGRSWTLHSVKAIDVSISKNGSVYLVSPEGRLHYSPGIGKGFYSITPPSQVQRVFYWKNQPYSIGAVWTIHRDQSIKMGYEWLGANPSSPAPFPFPSR